VLELICRATLGGDAADAAITMLLGNDAKDDDDLDEV
jgi:hypothetical protein